MVIRYLLQSRTWGTMMKRKEVTILTILVGFLTISLVSAAGPYDQGSGSGMGAGFTVTLPEPSNYNLTASETHDLQYMREEEQMAYDLYTMWSTMYSIPIFGNIAKAEKTHAREVQNLIDRYSVPTNKIGNLSAGYGNPDIQVLSTSLAEQGNLSLTDALKAGVAIEEQDIADLDTVIANTSREDLLQVYKNLRNGSENHLNAFTNQLNR